MAIVKMKKLRLLAVRTDREELLRELMLLGRVEITDPDKRLLDEELSRLTHRDESELTRFRSVYGELASALKLLDKYAPVKSKLFTPRPDVTHDVLLDESGLAETLDAVRTMTSADESIRRLAAEESRLRSLIESLGPWLDLDVPLEDTGTREADVITGAVPSTVTREELETAVYAAAEETQIFWISSDKEQHYLLVICHKQARQEAVEALRAYGFSPSSLTGLTGTAKANTQASEKRLAELDAQKEILASKIAAEAHRRDDIKLAADRINTHADRAAAAERLLVTESAFSLEGWVPAETETELTDLLLRYDCAWEFTDPEAGEIEAGEVPVELKNNVVTRPLSMVTEMYSLPAYDGVDPNPLMAPFFVLFYGMMFADMAYGIIMMIAGLVVKYKVKPKGRTMTQMFELMFLCGISAFLWGVVTGGFFGDAPLQIAKLINPNTTFAGLPALLNPIEDTIFILIGSLALGFVHIITGMAVSFVEKAKAGHVMDGVWDEGTWWVIFAGIALFVLGIGSVGGVPVVLLIGALMLIVGSGRDAKGIGKVTAVFGALYNGVTGFFGDILSYSRLMALMLAGSVIAMVFNTLGAIPGNIIFFFVIFIIGHALNFGLNLLGCYVHDLRLQCLEFFGKFYKDGGRPFKPLDVNTKYVNIVK